MVQRPPPMFLLCPAPRLLPWLWYQAYGTYSSWMPCQVAFTFMKAPRDSTGVSLARNVQWSYSNHPTPILPYISTASGAITTNLVTYDNIDLSKDSSDEKSKMDLSRMNEGVIRAVFLSGICSVNLFQLPEAAHIPWLTAPSIFKASNGQSSFSHHTAWC